MDNSVYIHDLDVAKIRSQKPMLTAVDNRHLYTLHYTILFLIN